MPVINVCSIIFCMTMIILSAAEIAAKEYVVESKQAYSRIATKLFAGDKVVLKNGTWKDFEILLQGRGTKGAPITLTAETKGKVILSGQSNLRLAGEYLVASGLIFKNGYTPSSAVVEFRRNKEELAYHSRVTEIVIDNYNKPNKQEPDSWVALYGKHNRFDHSHLVNKRNKGATVAVRLNTKKSQQNYHKIDHNYFGYRPIFGSNGGETLRIGTSHYSRSNSYTLVEKNYFEKTNGEVEIISVKSGKNTLRGNHFYQARGTLTLRHGNGNIIEENIFMGNSSENTGGVRVINKDQIIRNNYLEGLTGYRFGSGMTVMNGVPNSPINRYHQVENVIITNNTFVNVSHIQLAAGSDAERSAVPINSMMSDNLIINDDKQQPFSTFDDVSGIKLSGNIINSKVLPELAYGITQQYTSVKRLENGLLYPVSKKINAGVKRGLKVLAKKDTGVSWYPKTPAYVAFDSGRVHSLEPSPKVLLAAISEAKPGDILELAPGQYDIPKLIKINKTLTIRAKRQGKTKLTFERAALFEIHNGGSLKLDGFTISGESSPDSSGNSVVRTQKYGMIENYRFVMTNSNLVDLNINHSFNFFVATKGTFADEIILTNNNFNKITGDILRLNAEVDDLGIYNAEYVTLKSNSFSKVDGGVLKLYRGGTDESTFGPQFLMSNNKLSNVGLGKRNKRRSSVDLHGVQVANITDNVMLNSALIFVKHTVGKPKTTITNNTFKETEFPAIVELHLKGPHTAIIENNKIVRRSR